MDEQAQQGSGYATADDYVTEARRAHVSHWNAAFELAKKFWEPVFKQIRDDQRFARGRQWEQANGGLSSKDMYTANIVQRHIQQRCSALYAKNPTFVASAKRKVDYTVWDGKPDTIAKAQEQLMMAAQSGVPIEQVDPGLLAIMQDYNRVMVKREMVRRVGLTLELAFDHFISEQVVPFKKQMKRLVRRTLTTGVGYVKLGFQRVMQMEPESARKLADATQKLAVMERLAREHALGDFDDNAAEYDRLQSMIQQLQMEPGVVAREGLTIEYPTVASVIPDPKCENLDGFQGCDWVAEEFFLTPAAIKEIYDVDVGSAFRGYVCADQATKRYTAVNTAHYVLSTSGPGAGESFASVRVIYCKRDGLVYVTCEGYPDFLKEPTPPEIQLERFWPIFTLMLNEADDEESVFPQSDVFLLRHPQFEYNRARQALREHRAANRPKTYVGADRLSEEDVGKLKSHPANAVIELEAMQPGDRIEDILQPHRPPPIDLALYDTHPSFDDTMRVVGTQEANLGGTSNATATESSIAESSRLSSLDSNVDDLDELLVELARCAGQVLMMNCSEKTIRRLVGDGAVWPKLSPADIAEELVLTVAAGSSGRPNKAQEIQNFERLAPLLMQIPGIKPDFLAAQGLQRLDDKLDLTQAYSQPLPSVIAMNAMAPAALPPPPGAESDDPKQQGAQGADNAPKLVGTEGDTPGPGRPPMDPNLAVDSASGLALN